MRESELLEHIYARSAGLRASGGWSVAVGPGDDAAVLRSPGGDTLLMTVDQLVEGRHYEPGTAIDLIARKAVARSVSDIAAMGGTPTWAMATAVLPDACPHANELFDAMSRWAMHWGCPLVGGDIASHGATDHPLTLTTTIAGSMPAGVEPVLRSGARAGDSIYVTGALGGSFASGRHLTFETRVLEAAALGDALGGRLHAMIDLSDGLGRDAGRVAKASAVRIELEADAVPRHPGVAGWREALGEGEDYELCFAAAGDVPGEVAGTAVTRVGRVIAGVGCVVLDQDDMIDAGGLGWEH
ncbi:MAG: thiamine-monophosphate kinase [Phycisphaeraceae bacterium]|nr:MAG: thiamine-monophosphate kinase [Phycisphaeraceae bacterium]